MGSPQGGKEDSRVLQVQGAVAAFAAKCMDQEWGVLGQEVLPGKVADINPQKCQYQSLLG